jgi:hypothetical protein
MFPWMKVVGQYGNFNNGGEDKKQAEVEDRNALRGAGAAHRRDNPRPRYGPPRRTAYDDEYAYYATRRRQPTEEWVDDGAYDDDAEEYPYAGARKPRPAAYPPRRRQPTEEYWDDGSYPPARKPPGYGGAQEKTPPPHKKPPPPQPDVNKKPAAADQRKTPEQQQQQQQEEEPLQQAKQEPQDDIPLQQKAISPTKPEEGNKPHGGHRHLHRTAGWDGYDDPAGGSYYYYGGGGGYPPAQGRRRYQGTYCDRCRVNCALIILLDTDTYIYI